MINLTARSANVQELLTHQSIDWEKIHFLSEPAVTHANRFSFGVVELSQGKGHARHNHPGSEEIIYVVSGEGLLRLLWRASPQAGTGAG